MRILAALLAVQISLAGCADFRNAVSAAAGYTITQSQVDTARAGYDAAFLTPAANYARLPVCRRTQVATLANPCRTRALMLSLQAADQKVAVLFNKVQRQIDTGNNVGINAAYNDLLAAIGTAQGIVAAFNIQ